MDSIKGAFKKITMDVKFMGTGEGHTLKEDQGKEKAKEQSNPGPSQPARAPVLTEHQKRALEAAENRLQSKTAPKKTAAEASLQKKMMAEARESAESLGSSSASASASDSLSANVGPQVAIPPFEDLGVDTPQNKALAKAVYYLKLYGDELRRGDLATCSEVLDRYAENILKNPTEPKYRRIKLSNKVFSEKVGNVPGGIGVLKAAGFSEVAEEVEGGGRESFLVFREEADLEKLDHLRRMLQEPLVVERAPQIVIASPGQEEHLPDSFYSPTRDEAVAEQKRRKKEGEASQVLRTKAMRDREAEAKQMRKPSKITHIRIRFPEGRVLQGSFSPQEPPAALREFIQGFLEDPARPFTLYDPSRDQLVPLEATPAPSDAAAAATPNTLLALGLWPPCALNLRWATPQGKGLKSF